jgi:putative restriction endonuclease
VTCTTLILKTSWKDGTKRSTRSSTPPRRWPGTSFPTSVMSGIAEPALLRASHNVPWADCGDEQRLNVHIGLLLSALWDAAFDKGLVSFADEGTPLVSPPLSDAALAALSVDAARPIHRLRDSHCVNLTAHRARYGF